MKKIFIIIVLCLFVTGCFESKASREEREKYKSQATENAINYIEEKYGFEAAVKSIKLLYTYTGNGISYKVLTGEAELEMSYQDKVFFVRIDCDKITTNGYDNYQRELIDNGIFELVEEVFGKKPEKIQTYYDGIDKFFDGNNLLEVVDKNPVSVFISYYNYDLSNYNKVNLANKMNMNVYVYNFRSIEELNNFSYPLSDNCYEGIKIVETKDYMNYKKVFSIKQVIYSEKTSQIYYDFDINKLDNFYYLSIGGNIKNIYECSIDNLEEQFNNRNININNYTQISKTYCVDGDFEKIGLYYPKEYIENGYFVVNFPHLTYFNFRFERGNNLRDNVGYKYVIVDNISSAKDKSIKFVVFAEKENDV